MSPRYSREIGSFLRSQGQDPPESSVAPTTMKETFLNAPSSDVVPLMMSYPSIAPDTGRVALTPSRKLLSRLPLLRRLTKAK